MDGGKYFQWMIPDFKMSFYHSRYSRIFLSITLVCLPALMSLFWVYFSFHGTPFDFVPSESDEIFYWHETLDFTHVGLDGGYYTFEERAPRSPIFHFDAHGPIFPVLYGIFGKVFGWKYASAVLCNILVFSAALLIFLWLVKPDSRQLLLLIAFLLSFWPLPLFQNSNLQESVHQSGVVVLSIFLFLFTSQKEDKSFLLKAAALLFLFLISLLRKTWTLLFLPYLLLMLRPQSKLKICLVILLGLAIPLLVVVLHSHWQAPYPDSFFRGLKKQGLLSVSQGAYFLFQHSLENLKQFFSFRSGHPLEVLQRYQALLLLYVSYLIWSIRTFQFKGEGWSSEFEKNTTLFHLYSLTTITVFIILFYDVKDWRDYRVLAPYLMLLLISWIVLKMNTRWILLIILLNFTFTPVFYRSFLQKRSDNYLPDLQKIHTFSKEIEGRVSYKKGPNAWCNTVLSFVSPWPFLQPLVALPAGIGLSVVLDPHRLQFPLKSKYILLDERGWEFLKNRSNLELVSNTQIGVLYLNLDSKCL